jgi:two-component sensor histidine kinase
LGNAAAEAMKLIATRRLGFGLALISKMCDGFSIVERSSGGTEVRLRFDLSLA